jgi:uncharacterized membrane protein
LGTPHFVLADHYPAVFAPHTVNTLFARSIAIVVTSNSGTPHFRMQLTRSINRADANGHGIVIEHLSRVFAMLITSAVSCRSSLRRVHLIENGVDLVSKNCKYICMIDAKQLPASIVP